MMDGLVDRHASREKRRVLKLVLDPVGSQVEVEGRLCQLQDVVTGAPLEEPVPGHLGADVVDEPAGAVGHLDVLQCRLGAAWNGFDY